MNDDLTNFRNSCKTSAVSLAQKSSRLFRNMRRGGIHHQFSLCSGPFFLILTKKLRCTYVLPRMELPKFSLDWTAFWDAFQSMIKDSSLSDSYNLYYLRGCIDCKDGQTTLNNAASGGFHKVVAALKEDYDLRRFNYCALQTQFEYDTNESMKNSCCQWRTHINAMSREVNHGDGQLLNILG